MSFYGAPSDNHAFAAALEAWIDSLTPAERRAYAEGLGVDPAGDEFEQAMSDLYSEHLASDPFERDAFPAVPKVICSQETADYMNALVRGRRAA